MDDVGVIWFFIVEDIEKVEEVCCYYDVGLVYCDVKGMCYVLVVGIVEIVYDCVKMQEFYFFLFDIWFEDGLDMFGIVLFKVILVVVEFWEFVKGKVVMVVGVFKVLVIRDILDDDIMNYGCIIC